MLGIEPLWLAPAKIRKTKQALFLTSLLAAMPPVLAPAMAATAVGGDLPVPAADAGKPAAVCGAG
jgi:hypothetical protein